MRFTVVFFFAILALAALATHGSPDHEDKDEDDDCGKDFLTIDDSKWSGGTQIRKKSAKSVSDCYEICEDTEDCFSFTYGRGKCYMYEEFEDELEHEDAKGFKAGYINFDNCDDEDEAEEDDEGEEMPTCDDGNWEYDFERNARWVGSSPVADNVGSKNGTSAKNVNACGNLCIDIKDCFTFTFDSSKKMCYIFCEDYEQDDLEIEDIKGFRAGWIYCDEGDKKKKFFK